MPVSGLRNKVIGQAGEFAVCAQLGKLGLIATPFAGNVPEFDLIVVDDAMTPVPIQVKTSFKNNTWITGDVRTYLDVVLDEGSGVQTLGAPVAPENPNLIYVYVWLSPSPGTADRFFLLTKAEVWRKIARAYENWISERGGIRPRNQASFHSAIGMSDIAEYENNWDLIRDRLKSLHPA